MFSEELRFKIEVVASLGGTKAYASTALCVYDNPIPGSVIPFYLAYGSARIGRATSPSLTMA